MLIWILRRMDLPESRIRNLVEKLTRVKIVASSVFYTLMVFIVIFGISGDVYAGFPRIVPYIIIAVFLFMAFIRIYQCMVDDSYIRQVAAKRVDDSEKKSRERAEKAAGSNPLLWQSRAIPRKNRRKAKQVRLQSRKRIRLTRLTCLNDAPSIRHLLRCGLLQASAAPFFCPCICLNTIMASGIRKIPGAPKSFPPT